MKERDPDPEPAIVTLPSTLVYRTTSFGFRPKEKKPDITPGPEHANAIPIGSEAPKYSFRIKREEVPNKNPGIDENVIGKTYPQGVKEHVYVEIAMLMLVMQI